MPYVVAVVLEELDHVERGALANVRNVGLVRGTHGHDGRSRDVPDRRPNARRDSGGSPVVDAPGGGDERRVLGIDLLDEPRIEWDAVTSDADPRLMNGHPWVAIRQRDHLERVNADPIGDLGELVRERDVDVAEAVLGQLGQLRCHVVGPEKGTLDDSAIEPG